jgi:hypothetical protein
MSGRGKGGKGLGRNRATAGKLIYHFGLNNVLQKPNEDVNYAHVIDECDGGNSPGFLRVYFSARDRDSPDDGEKTMVQDIPITLQDEEEDADLDSSDIEEQEKEMKRPSSVKHFPNPTMDDLFSNKSFERVFDEFSDLDKVQSFTYYPYTKEAPRYFEKTKVESVDKGASVESKTPSPSQPFRQAERHKTQDRYPYIRFEYYLQADPQRLAKDIIYTKPAPFQTQRQLFKKGRWCETKNPEHVEPLRQLQQFVKDCIQTIAQREGDDIRLAKAIYFGGPRGVFDTSSLVTRQPIPTPDDESLMRYSAKLPPIPTSGLGSKSESSTTSSTHRPSSTPSAQRPPSTPSAQRPPSTASAQRPPSTASAQRPPSAQVYTPPSSKSASTSASIKVYNRIFKQQLNRIVDDYMSKTDTSALDDESKERFLQSIRSAADLAFQEARKTDTDNEGLQRKQASVQYLFLPPAMRTTDTASFHDKRARVAQGGQRTGMEQDDIETTEDLVHPLAIHAKRPDSGNIVHRLVRAIQLCDQTTNIRDVLREIRNHIIPYGSMLPPAMKHEIQSFWNSTFLADGTPVTCEVVKHNLEFLQHQLDMK